MRVVGLTVPCAFTGGKDASKHSALKSKLIRSHLIASLVNTSRTLIRIRSSRFGARTKDFSSSELTVHKIEIFAGG